MEHHRNGLADPTRRNSIFRADSLDLIGCTFASNLSYFRNYRRDDRMAELFLGNLMDVIDCTFYTVRKNRGDTKEKITDALTEFWSESVNGSSLLKEMTDPRQSAGIVEENNLMLESLRETYASVVRSPFDRCWPESTGSAAEGLDECRSRVNGCGGAAEGDDPGRMEQCTRYYSSWRGSLLALESHEELCGDPAKLSGEVRDRCRLLSLLAVPEKLEAFIASEYGPDAEGRGGKRTIRGLIVRLLSLLADECLDDINRLMDLPPEQSFYLARRPC